MSPTPLTRRHVAALRAATSPPRGGGEVGAFRASPEPHEPDCYRETQQATPLPHHVGERSAHDTAGVVCRVRGFKPPRLPPAVAHPGAASSGYAVVGPLAAFVGDRPPPVAHTPPQSPPPRRPRSREPPCSKTARPPVRGPPGLA